MDAHMSRRKLLAFGGVAVGALAYPEPSHATYTVRNGDDLMKALGTVDSTRPAKLTINVPANTYVLSDTARINQSNVAIIAEPGTKIVLANHTNKPVIAVGSQEEVPTTFIENVYISGLEIDGNKANQDSEQDTQRPWIRNNGIDVRSVRRLVLENVVVHDARSGGAVISWGSSDIHVVKSAFEQNVFDGVAYYASQRIHTSGCTMRHNKAAGVSLDNDLRNCTFADCIVDGNEDVGIFARHSRELRFNNCAVTSSGNYAAFLSHDEAGNGVFDIMFSVCQMLRNPLGGIYVASTADKSAHTSVVGCVFRENGGNAIKSDGSVIWQAANIVMP